MNEGRYKMLEDVERVGKHYQGYLEIKKHLGGELLTMKNGIKAKCYDCMGFYEDGAIDCKVPTCPLYNFMPYNKDKEKRTTNRKPMTEEHKNRLKDAAQKKRSSL
jgi:hypothetical protein